MIELLSIEAHNERTKEEYASNTDIDKSRSHLNFHLIEPKRKYRAKAERQIKDAAFDRCVNVMARLMLKYGNKVLEQRGRESPAFSI